MKKVALLFALTIIVLPCIAQVSIHKNEACRKASDTFLHGDRQGALAILDEAIAKDPALFEALQMRAEYRGLMNDFNGAISDYKAALVIDPTAVDVYEDLAFFQRFQRDYDGALATLDAAIAHGLKSEKVYAERGDLKRDRLDTAGALADYQNAIAADPNSVHAYLGMARLYDTKGDRAAAIAALQTFFKTFEAKGSIPKDRSVTIKGSPAQRYERPGGKDPDGSLTVIGHPGTIIVLGDSAEEVKRNEAENRLAKGIRSAYYVLGDLYRKIGDLDQALASYDKGLATKSDDGLGHSLRGRARIAKGDLQGAIDDLNAALKDVTPYADPDQMQGLVYILEGREDDAAKQFALYLQHFPQAKDDLARQIDEARALRLRAPAKN